MFIDELCFTMRVYLLHELVEIAKRAEWELVKVFGDTATLSRFRPCLSSINVVFKASR